MPIPELGPVAQWVYDYCKPLAYDDANQRYALAHWIKAWCQHIEDIAAIVTDSDEGPGWTSITDADRVPVIAAGFLAQIVGTTLVRGQTLEQTRARIKNAAGLRRGGPDAMRGEIRAELTGVEPTVKLFERIAGNAYRFLVATKTAETPDAAKVVAAILRQKPAALKYEHVVYDGDDYDSLKATHVDYDEVKLDFANYAEIVLDPTQT